MTSTTEAPRQQQLTRVYPDDSVAPDVEELGAIVEALESWGDAAKDVQESLESLVERLDDMREPELAPQEFDEDRSWKEWSSRPLYESELALVEAHARFKDACTEAEAAGSAVESLLERTDEVCRDDLKKIAGRISDFRVALVNAASCQQLLERIVDGASLGEDLRSELHEAFADAHGEGLSGTAADLQAMAQRILGSAPLVAKDKAELERQYSNVAAKIHEVEYSLRAVLEWRQTVTADVEGLASGDWAATLTSVTRDLCSAAAQGRQPAGLELAREVSWLERLHAALVSGSVMEPRIRMVLDELGNAVNSLRAVGALFVGGATPDTTSFPESLRLSNRGWAAPSQSASIATYEIEAISADARVLQLFACDAAGWVLASATVKQASPFIPGQWVQFRIDVDRASVLAARVQALG